MSVSAWRALPSEGRNRTTVKNGKTGKKARGDAGPPYFGASRLPLTLPGPASVGEGAARKLVGLAADIAEPDLGGFRREACASS